MDTKWPFMLITFGLLFILGLMISSIEKSSVMKNWDKRRCDFPVMAASMFFKPDDDPRTKSQFSQDNFSFCMKSYVDKFLGLFMAPINSLFSKQTKIAGDSINMVNTMRNIANSIYNAFMEYISQFTRKFNSSVFEMSRIVQYLGMAMKRLNAIMISMVYSGITLFRGMLNTIQFVIKVILIICGIMLAIIIILFFVLFPFIPLILSVLTAIIAVVLALSMVLTGSIADQAKSQRSGFCFSKDTLVLVETKLGRVIKKKVSDIKLGDKLGFNCGKVTAVIVMDGKNVPMYTLNGIVVSGSHLVKGEDGIWKSVAQDKRAKLVNEQTDILYCFNTTTHNIPIVSCTETCSVILFRDWEEIADDDDLGQYTWNYLILKRLNNLSNYSKWKDSLKVSAEMPIMGKKKKVKTVRGFVEISKLNILVDKVVDRYGKEQNILGIVKGLVKNGLDNGGKWNTELYEYIDKIWKKGKSTIIDGKDDIEGVTIITESGEFIILDEDENKERIVRDFTDIGYKTIHETYPFVATRLRTKE
jgi:hypothetical protein